MTAAATGFVLGGVGKALPDQRLDNETLAKALGVDAEGIFQRTGILERRVAREGETASTLGAAAARQALERAGVGADELDLIVLSTYTPDHQLCPTSPALASAIGATRAGVFDLNAACSGGVIALMTGSSMLAGSPFGTILIVTADLSSFFVREDDPKTRMVFGDGAAAMLMRRPQGAKPAPWRILGLTLGSDGTGAELFRVPDGGSARPPINGFKLNTVRTIEMNGRAVFRFAVDRGAQVVENLCRQAGLALDSVDHVIPHQANLRIIASMAERTAIPRERWFTNLERYGNTASSSVPLALTEMIEEGRIRAGETVLLVAFGAGLAWSGMLLEAGAVTG